MISLLNIKCYLYKKSNDIFIKNQMIYLSNIFNIIYHAKFKFLIKYKIK